MGLATIECRQCLLGSRVLQEVSPCGDPEREKESCFPAQHLQSCQMCRITCMETKTSLVRNSDPRPHSWPDKICAARTQNLDVTRCFTGSGGWETPPSPNLFTQHHHHQPIMVKESAPQYPPQRLAKAGGGVGRGGEGWEGPWSWKCGALSVA